MQQLTGPLDEPATALLLRRAEGWVAGLHLASLSLRSAADTTATVDILRAESDPYVFDYLFEQVYSQQPPAVQEYLVKTAILDRISPSLARAVVGPGAAMPTTLVEVERAGLFLNALDNSGEWFTYHALFRDALRKLLAETYTPAEIAALHLRASEWFAQSGLVADAITHALAGGDASRAAQIVAARIPHQLTPDGWRTVEQWLGPFDPPTLALSPLLLVAKAYVLMYQFKWDAMMPFISQAEAQLADPQAALDPEHKVLAEAFLHWIWAYRWITTLDAQRASDAARRALALLPPRYAPAAGMILHALAIAMQWLGEVEAAERILNEALIALPTQSTDPQAVFGPLQSLTTLFLAEGYLVRGTQVAESLLRKADEIGAANMKAWACLSLGAAAYYGNDVRRAIDYFAAGVHLRYSSNPVASEQCFLGLALAYQVLGHDDEAWGVLATMRDYHRELALPALNADYRALQARLALMRGDIATARQWSDDKVDDAGLANGWLVVPVVVTLRVRLADNPSPADLDEILAELDRLQRALSNLWQPTRQTELLTLKAAALFKRGRRPEAHQALDDALALAEPRGLIRPIVDIGPSLEPLLQEKLRAHSSPFLVRLLNALRPMPSAPEVAPRQLPHLTTREREVLALLAQYQTDRAIAETLVIAPVTVRTHIENLAGKLGVRGRRAIVDRARELALLPGAG
jgi:LuxR family maltose regulon positive regulatory protein